ncbi:unnamed protein product [Clavelina lepadiformis]|uniref:Serine/threonine-protein phosphatase PGAM5, mitochondrial n=1 Tax=Clavelina lepadiformis TaxID=159417 RepID=A0ABP0FVI9_CLALP
MRLKALKICFALGTTGSAFALTINHVDRIDTIFSKTQAATTNSFCSNPTALWDFNWDKRDPVSLINPCELVRLQKNGNDAELEDLISSHTPTATRHLIFIRHGQYHTEFKEDEKRTLTALGKKQAIATGLRLREITQDKFTYSRVVESSMTRAIETCGHIREELGITSAERTDMLREGSPISPVPNFRNWRPETSVFTDGPRIEAAFRKFVHRASTSQKQDSFEIVVCHANVIRYFVCRALQMPPEAWLRISLRHGSLTWLTIHPSGTVSMKCLGEAGHMSHSLLSTE